jgi:hypothetical protein
MLNTFCRGLHRRTAAYLFAIDFFFIAATAVTGLLAAMNYLDTIPPLLNIGRDWSIPETFNYLKWLAVAVIFFMAYLRHGHTIFVSLSGVFLVLMLDDSLQLHERFGRLLSTSLTGHDEYRNFAQMLFWAAMAIGFVLFLSRSFPRAPKDVQRSLVPLLVPFAGLVFFGVFVDFLHSFTEDGTIVAGIFILLEDGGELLMISSIAAYTVKQFALPIAAANRIGDQ